MPKHTHLLGYASWAGIAPSDINSGHVIDLFAYHKQYGSRGRKAKDAVAVWNAVQCLGVCSSLPVTILKFPSGKRVVNPSWNAYPPSFKRELDSYINWLRGHDRLAPVITAEMSAIDANTQREFSDQTQTGRPRRTKTVGSKHAEVVLNAVRQTAGALVRNGRDPAGIQNLSDIATLPALRTSLSDIRLRLTNEGKFDVEEESGYRHQVGTAIISLAKEWLHIPAGDLAYWRRDLKQIRPSHLGGMSPRRAAQLRKFDDPQYRTAWYTVAGRLRDRAEASRKAGGISEEAVCDMQVALSVEILQSIPVRGGNLASIRFKGDRARRNLVLPQRMRDPVWVSWAPHEVKNDQFLKARLTVTAVTTLRLYLEHYYEAALRLHGIADSDFLFPSSDPSASKSEALLNKVFKARVQQSGLDMTLHLARHLAAKIVLDRDPNLLVVVSRLLGHKSLETTRKFYCENRTEAASEKYREAVLEDAQELRKRANLHAARDRRRTAKR